MVRTKLETLERMAEIQESNLQKEAPNHALAGRISDKAFGLYSSARCKTGDHSMLGYAFNASSCAACNHYDSCSGIVDAYKQCDPSTYDSSK
jgi:hypothetical protein